MIKTIFYDYKSLINFIIFFIKLNVSFQKEIEIFLYYYSLFYFILRKHINVYYYINLSILLKWIFRYKKKFNKRIFHQHFYLINILDLVCFTFFNLAFS